MPRAAAFLDLDRTVIARSSTCAFSRPLYAGGLLTRTSVLRSAYAHLAFRMFGADDEQVMRLRAAMTSMVAGWPVQQVRDIVEETLHELIDPMVYEEAAQLIEEHRTAGRDVVIVSASGSDVVGPIAAMLGADRSIATELGVRDGRYTGEVETWLYGDGKAQAMRALAQEAGYDLAACHAYSDSLTDLPMLEAVGHPSAVNPDRGLRRVARARGWPVLVFTRPVPLRSRVGALRPSPRAAAVGAAAVGAGAATAGVVWAARRRARGSG